MKLSSIALTTASLMGTATAQTTWSPSLGKYSCPQEVGLTCIVKGANGATVLASRWSREVEADTTIYINNNITASLTVVSGSGSVTCDEGCICESPGTTTGASPCTLGGASGASQLRSVTALFGVAAAWCLLFVF
jgi:hypothetical protein